MPFRVLRLFPASKRPKSLSVVLLMGAATAIWFGYAPEKAGVSASQTLNCEVSHVHDGDTLRAECPGQKKSTRVRIRQIDAPEMNQKYGIASRDYLRQICRKGDPVLIKVHSKDKYDRLLADIQCNGQEVGFSMINAGAAWVYEQYVEDRALIQTQRKAREARRGLWQEHNPVPPWQFRRDQRQ